MSFRHLEKMKSNNRLMKFLEKYTAKKCSPDISIELPDNHFYNKKVQHERKTNLELKSKGNRRRRISKKLNRKDSSLKVSIIDMKLQQEKETTSNIRIRRHRLETMPSTLKVMPLIPFWRTSFDIIEPQAEHEQVKPVVVRNQARNLGLTESDYMTMKRKGSDKTEPIYI